MRATLLVILAAGALGVAGCDAPAPEKPAPAAAAPAASPPPPPPEPAAAPPPSSTVPGLTEAYKTEAEWIGACKGSTPPIPESVCTCVSKAAVAQVGAEGLYNWMYEFFVNRDGFARTRADRWFESKGIDKAKQQKLADATGKCFVTQ
jgi:hypothetical protein